MYAAISACVLDELKHVRNTAGIGMRNKLAIIQSCVGKVT